MFNKTQNYPSGAGIEIVQLMRQALADRQARREGYSLRAFALSLRLTPAELSEVFSGKRRVTRRMALKVFDSLGVDPATEHRLISALPEKQIRKRRKDGGRSQKSPTAPTRSFIQLSTDEFRVVADWYHLAILSLCETTTFRTDEAWIAKRLGISRYDVRSALETLTRLGLVVRDARGKLRSTGKQFATTNEISDSSIRKNHAQGLELARSALESVPVELREFGASVIAADPSRLPAAKARLRELRREIAEILEGGEKKEVYRLSIQLFPLSRN